MKIALCSDLHLEFGDINLTNDEGADVLILSGDILIAQDLHDHPHMDYDPYTSGALADLGRRQQTALRFRDFIKRCSFQFPHVVYVAGNHEFYHGKFIGSLQDLRDECSKYPNVYFMEDDMRTINDVTFIGSTLWTDMNKGDPLTLHAVADMMNDYRIIRHDGHGYSKLRPAHTAARHRRSVEYIRTIIEGRFDEKFVVVGHMAPSKLSVHPRYQNDTLMNGAYASDLSEFIMDHPQIKLWTHGHTHHKFDYMIGSTRIVCNPRGYIGYEDSADLFELQYLEV
jgi:Icc-related predicted phosphoesterase